MVIQAQSRSCGDRRSAHEGGEFLRLSVGLRGAAALGLAVSLAAAVFGCGDDEPRETTERERGLSPGGSGSVENSGQGGSGSSAPSASGGSPAAAGSTGSEASPQPTAIDMGAAGSGNGSGASASDAGAVGGPEVADAGPPEPNPPAFAPCPTDGSACEIMPLGDSITFGIASPDGAGYRLGLFEQAVADGHTVTLVGRVQAGPTTNVQGQPFPTNNEGYSGATISTGMNQLADRVDAALVANPPHIILLHIGTNNLYQGMAPEVPGQLATLLDQITEGAPDALVVVTQITPLAEAGAQFSFPDNGVDEYNALVPGIVQERVDAGKHLILVNMNAAFRAANANVVALLADGIHPNATGYDVMAQTWYDAIETFLP
jgi:lysophospholipase L1-like esterase